MILSQARAVTRGGFTLMEVLVVVAILVVVAGVGGVVMMRYLDESKEKAAKLGVQNIEQAVMAYKVSNGEYPPSLGVLVSPTDGKPAVLEQSALTDPWNQAYQYEPQTINPQTHKPLIYSMGPNQATQIANWTP